MDNDFCFYRCLGMKNKQDINVGCFLHPVRDVSLGRKAMHHGTLHPYGRDAGRMGRLHLLPKDVFLWNTVSWLLTVTGYLFFVS